MFVAAPALSGPPSVPSFLRLPWSQKNAVCGAFTRAWVGSPFCAALAEPPDTIPALFSL